jgi:hypothetical protein
LIKRYSEEEAHLFQSMMSPQEDLPPGTWAKYGGAYRWFRSPNIVCIEHYRPAAMPAQRTKPAA